MPHDRPWKTREIVQTKTRQVSVGNSVAPTVRLFCFLLDLLLVALVLRRVFFLLWWKDRSFLCQKMAANANLVIICREPYPEWCACNAPGQWRPHTSYEMRRTYKHTHNCAVYGTIRKTHWILLVTSVADAADGVLCLRSRDMFRLFLRLASYTWSTTQGHINRLRWCAYTLRTHIAYKYVPLFRSSLLASYSIPFMWLRRFGCPKNGFNDIAHNHIGVSYCIYVVLNLIYEYSQRVCSITYYQFEGHLDSITKSQIGRICKRELYTEYNSRASSPTLLWRHEGGQRSVICWMDLIEMFQHDSRALAAFIFSCVDHV